MSDAEFALRVRELADPSRGNADILVDDVSFLGSPFFQDGLAAQEVDRVVTRLGVAYFSAAGNSARNAYESINFAGNIDSAGIFAGTFHDFDPGAGADTRQQVTLDSGLSGFIFQWDDPFFTTNGVDTDLDIFLLEAGTGNILAQSTERNIQNQTPLEILQFDNTSAESIEAEVVINLFAGAEPGRIKIFIL
ncbi:MAG: hypothetical protein HC908_19010 [Calothrix sp. SM1_7_51]|nr:hypothetical protein [Calothrix sp. SM1_7_51]